MASFILTVVGDDHPGLVSTISASISSHGGSWERSQMARLAGKFAGVVLVKVPDARFDELVAELRANDPELHVAVERTDEPPAQQPATMRLELLGANRPGIVADISTCLADQRISIDELTTEVRDAPMAGGNLFEARARLSVPPGVDVDVLRSSLERLADELMVDIALDTE